jgi:hypothetical protein
VVLVVHTRLLEEFGSLVNKKGVDEKKLFDSKRSKAKREQNFWQMLFAPLGTAYFSAPLTNQPANQPTIWSLQQRVVRWSHSSAFTLRLFICTVYVLWQLYIIYRGMHSVGIVLRKRTTRSFMLDPNTKCFVI